jgi:hypothetical protein
MLPRAYTMLFTQIKNVALPEPTKETGMDLNDLTEQWYESLLGYPLDDERINDIKEEPLVSEVITDIGKEYELKDGVLVERN